MKTVLMASLASLIFMLAASPAQAEWWYTKQGAEQIVKEHVRKNLGYYAATACRPYGKSRANNAYKYHRWVCGWAGSVSSLSRATNCSGRYTLVGSRNKGAYYAISGKHHGKCSLDNSEFTFEH